jgi:hypothetical protein
MKRSTRTTLLVAAIGAVACATLAEGGGGEEALPNAGAGPFRPIRQPELGNLRSAPNALEDDDLLPRDASILDDDGDPATLAVHAYVAATLVPEEEQPPSPELPPNAILRYGAVDGRSFDRAAEQMLVAELDWEGGTVGAPSAVRLGSEVLLFYAAAGGIGLARGDGASFSDRSPEPVLAPDASGWEKSAVPSDPGVVVLDDGSLAMFYEVDPEGDGRTRIGEARSTDGASWTRVGGGPALGLGTAADVPAGEAVYDDGAAGDPFPLLATMADGQRVLRLYYAATDVAGARTIGLAARRSDSEPFARAVSPVFGTGSKLGARSPCVVPFADFTLLFATQRTSVSESEDYPAVAAGVAPATLDLPAPDPQ